MYIILCEERKIKKVGPPRRSDDDSVFHVVWRLSWPTGRGEQVMLVTSAALIEAQTHVRHTEQRGCLGTVGVGGCTLGRHPVPGQKTAFRGFPPPCSVSFYDAWHRQSDCRGSVRAQMQHKACCWKHRRAGGAERPSLCGLRHAATAFLHRR